MRKHSIISTTILRDFKIPHQDVLTTPESISITELHQPSPPRQRLKVRRRVKSSLQAPTDQFLASVAAADFPLRTIENSQNLENFKQLDENFKTETDSLVFQGYDSTPKITPSTPLSSLSTDKREIRPDWYLGAIRENKFNRVSSSHSIDSDISHDSSSGNEKSGCVSENESCTSLESEFSDPFSLLAVKASEEYLVNEGESKGPAINRLNSKIRSRTRNNAPWSMAQTVHLWTVYLLYLQDPTVTPLRIGASRVPPEGVCHRVAREARRRWKGPRTLQFCNSHVTTNLTSKSNSSAPTGKKYKAYAQWPHSNSATRSKLRNLCRQRDPSELHRFHHYLQARSPTPFSKSNPCWPAENLASDPNRNSLDFHDISISLSLSTAVSMQPDGALSRLAHAGIQEDSQAHSNLTFPFGRIETHGNKRNSRYRLGSPFSHSYGPSSSKVKERPALSVSGSLGSPLQFDRTRSLNETQKRRAFYFLREEYSPTIPTNQFTKSCEGHMEDQIDQPCRVRTRRFSAGHESRATQALHSALDLLPPPTFSLTWPQGFQSHQSRTYYPPRLKSPFAESGSRNTFPRLHNSISNSTYKNSPVNNFHQTCQSTNSFEFEAQLNKVQLQDPVTGIDKILQTEK